MIDKIQVYINISVNYLQSVGIIGGFFLIVLESIIPALPLGVFVTLNMLSFGDFFGFVISWFGTICGCMLSYVAFRYFFRNIFYKMFKQKTKVKVENIMLRISKMDFNGLVVLLAMPFTPAFLINIAAGLANMPIRKYFFSLLIGKIAMVYFWGYVGTNLIESIKTPLILLKIVVIMGIAYLVSKVLEKIVKVE